MTHTPGPWIPYTEIGSEGNPHWNVAGPSCGGPLPLCQVHDGNGLSNGYGGCLSEIKANAHLIAAAPDLLEALIELDQWAQSQQGSEYPAGTFEFVQNAIQKATGVK